MSESPSAANPVSAQAAVLSYAASPGRIRPPLLLRHFHVWLLPILWVPGAWGSRIHHGDEYFGFIMANLLGGLAWMGLAKLLKLNDLGTDWGFLIIVATGFLLLAGIGWLMDRLRAWKWVYLLMPIAFVGIVKSRIAIPGHIPPIADYPGQEWEWDALCVAYCWAVYMIALLTLFSAALGRLALWSMRWGLQTRSPAAASPRN